MTNTEGAIQVEIRGSAAALRSADGAIGRLPDGAEYTSGLAGIVYETVTPEEIQNAIERICTSVTNALAKVNPDSCSVEFSLGFKAGAKVPVLVNGEANATFKVSLNWKKAAGSSR